MSTNDSPGPALPRFLKITDIVPGMIPVTRSTLWRWIRKGTFPAPHRLVTKPRLWLASEVIAWMLGTWVKPSQVQL